MAASINKPVFVDASLIESLVPTLDGNGTLIYGRFSGLDYIVVRENPAVVASLLKDAQEEAIGFAEEVVCEYEEDDEDNND